MLRPTHGQGELGTTLSVKSLFLNNNDVADVMRQRRLFLLLVVYCPLEGGFVVTGLNTVFPFILRPCVPDSAGRELAAAQAVRQCCQP